MSFNGPERRNVYSLNTISDKKGDKMSSMNQNVPQNGQINKCSSGSRIPESRFIQVCGLGLHCAGQERCV